MTDPRPPGTDLRRAILDQTRHLLIADGYNSLSMRKIARAVGCSATSIYLHFENKDALFHALIDEGMDVLYERLREATEATGDPVARLAALSRVYVRFGLDNPEYYEIMFMLHLEHMSRYPAEKYRRARRNLRLFAQTLRDGTDADLFDVPDARIGASVMWSVLHGTVALLLARRLDVRIDQTAFIEATVQHVIDGFRASVASPTSL